jgi:hypothetical protein
MTNFPEYTDTDYIALGHYLRREMFGVELNEDEQILATMSILKFPEIEIPEDSDEEKIRKIGIGDKFGLISKDGWITKPIYELVGISDENLIVAKLNNNWGHLDLDGNFIECEEDNMKYLQIIISGDIRPRVLKLLNQFNKKRKIIYRATV